MLTARELMTALFATLRLIRREPDALAWFDASLDGFWRSFAAAGLVAPLYVLSLLLWPDTVTIPAPDPTRLFLLKAIAYVMGWVAYPLVVISMLRRMNREGHFFRYLVAYNWFQLPKEAVFFLLALFYSAGVIPGHGAQFLSLIAFAATLYYFWYIARSALEVDGYTAAGMVLIDLTLSLLISGIADRA